ncbi:hypothetical protein CES87_06750 [Pseudomonas sp. ERMR1:02]|nr:hypothetical protein CES87_06750 [Pseudomonas sp. ERMR1:02]
MRGKLQNFAKAAILAITQQNCSIDHAAPSLMPATQALSALQARALAVLFAIYAAINCEYL